MARAVEALVAVAGAVPPDMRHQLADALVEVIDEVAALAGAIVRGTTMAGRSDPAGPADAGVAADAGGPAHAGLAAHAGGPAHPGSGAGDVSGGLGSVGDEGRTAVAGRVGAVPGSSRPEGPSEGWASSPEGASEGHGGRRAGAAKGTEQPRTGGEDSGAGERLDDLRAVATLATRLLEEARMRRGMPARSGVTAAGPGSHPQPNPTTADRIGRSAGVGPAVSAGSLVAGQVASPDSGSPGLSESSSRPVVSGVGARQVDVGEVITTAMARTRAQGARMVVGYADVLGVADPGIALQLLQSRVLSALVAGDVPAVIGPGQVVFVLPGADLVEADRRFRHVVVPPGATAPIIRLGLVEPRPAETAEAALGRARGIAVGLRPAGRLSPTLVHRDGSPGSDNDVSSEHRAPGHRADTATPAGV